MIGIATALTRGFGPLAALARLAVACGLLVALVAGVGLADLLGSPWSAPEAGPPPKQRVEAAPVAPGSAAPPADQPAVDLPQPPAQQPAQQPSPPQQARGQDDPVRAWASRVSANVDVPERAIIAYVNADLAMRTHEPRCHLSWATLAGIARIESDHGRYGGTFLRSDARPAQPIYGVPLNGAPGIRRIPDTDRGVLDGDASQDRAVGPFQFLPSTWRKWSTDGNGDGIGDPQNLDDASMAAARYLCSENRDLSTGQGWWSALFSYNNSVQYGQEVYALAESYARAGNRGQ